MERSEIAIIIPAFNEARTISVIVREASRYGVAIVVDDCSRDGTAQEAQKSGALVVRHEKNQGYDAALNSGFKKALEKGCVCAITLDADGQHPAALLEQFIGLLKNTPMVLGYREKTARISERVFAGLAKILYGIKDPLCGMKGYSLKIYQALGHFDCYHSIGTELALYGAKHGYAFQQILVPIAPRQDHSRLGNRLKVNLKIFRAMLYSFKVVRSNRHYPSL